MMAAFTAHHMRVVVDGVDISGMVRSVDVHAEAGSLVVTHLQLLGRVTMSPEGVVAISSGATIEAPEMPGSDLVVRSLTLGPRQVAPNGLPMES